MDEKVKEQILAIRDTDLTNMFDINTVQRLAYERDFYELTPTERGNGGFGSTGRTDFPETKPDPVPEWEE